MAFFKTRARTVDMLGRQQIAGVPTAVSELFKNAFDAYATHVEVDFYRSDGLFVLRDDGIGMTRTDFEARWLTLGTDSKLLSGGLPMPRVPEGTNWRPVLGEKGIGRLAIAAIGDLTLVLTRARYHIERDEIVAALLHWGIFALPGVDLQDIEIPVTSFKPERLPGKEEIYALAQRYVPVLDRLRAKTDESAVEQILSDLNSVSINPREMDGILMAPTLVGRGASGTHFFVQPADESMYAALSAPRASKEPSNLVRLLIGFANTMTPGHPPVPISTAFRDHDSDDSFQDIIAQSEFFTPAEFNNADHQIQGRFDEYGWFHGNVKVYGELNAGYSVSFGEFSDENRKIISCGPFELSVAIIQGEEDASMLPSSDYHVMKQKLDQLGGLYIYNDGIRVLPYGDSRSDFIDIEKRRTLNAGRYFFSYRRMFGVIQIDRQHNSALKEKAGREGFRDNKAFREFREILINFFKQVAVDFFRTNAQRSDRFSQYRDELERAHVALKEKESKAAVARHAFQSQVADVLAAIDRGDVGELIHAIFNQLEKTLAAAARDSSARISRADLAAFEADAIRQLRATRESFHLNPPRGIGLSKSLKRDYESYLSAYESLTTGEFNAAFVQLENRIRAEPSYTDVGDRTEPGLEEALQKSIDEALSSVADQQHNVADASTQLAFRIDKLMSEIQSDLTATFDQYKRSISSSFSHNETNDSILPALLQMQLKIESKVTEATSTLSAIVDQINSINSDTRVGGKIVTNSEISAALEEKMLALQERADADIELTQLGLSVQVINHEFSASIQAVRNNIRRIKPWADLNPDLERIYRGLRASFETLDGYLSLFTPLQRRLYRKPSQIAGGDIARFIEDALNDRLEKAEIVLSISDGFKNARIYGFPSTFFPVFVNLIDNAAYWLESRSSPREISLTVGSLGELLVSNNGPKIQDRDSEVIFELGFSRKPTGRGMGLHIAREALARDGYLLHLMRPAIDGMTVTFSIQRSEQSNDHGLNADYHSREDV